MPLLSLTAPQSLRAGAAWSSASGRTRGGLRPQGEDDEAGLPPINPRLTAACGVRLAAAIATCLKTKGGASCARMAKDAGGDCMQAAYDYLGRMSDAPTLPRRPRETPPED